MLSIGRHIDALVFLKAGPPDEPRDPHGQWTDGGGDAAGDTGSAAVPPPPQSNKVTGIKGMPKDSVIVSRELAVAENRGAFTMAATERKKGTFETGRRFEVSIAAKLTPGIESYKVRATDDHPQYYDPHLATLVTEDKGERWERQRAVANDQSKRSITPLDRKDVIYRGMSAEEYEGAKAHGYFESRGEYNIGGAQEGLTYWSNEVDTAESYSNGFAPWQFKATFEKPAYVVAIPKPANAVDHPRYPNETGVPGRIPTSAIVAAWRGDVFDHQPAKRDAIEEKDNEYRLGGGVGGSSQVVWTKQDGVAKARALHYIGKYIPHLVGKYDENEPRDEQGRWTDGGGSGDAGGGTGGGGKPDAGGTSDTGGRAGASSHAYTSRSPRASEASRNVAAVHEPRDGKGVTFEELTRAGASDFHKQVAAAKSANPNGAAVELHTPEQYETMRTFQTPDGAGVFALDGGNIVSAAKNPSSSVKGFAKQALTLATEQGGNRLDAFDTALPEMYSRAGFKAVARLPFNDQYKPDGWDYKQFADYNGGRPDVVFMVHDPANAKAYKPGDGKTVATYEEGIAAQTAALKETALTRIEASVPGAKEAVAAARAKLAKGVRTDALVSEGGHKTAQGRWSPGRGAAHAAILEKTFAPERVAAATPKEGEQPVAHLLGGSGGSGKSFFTKPGGTVKTDNAIYLNSDDVKAALPGYEGWNAALFHEESSEVNQLTEKLARDARLNVIVDGTMGKLSSLNKRIDEFKKAGYRVEGHFMRVTPETSATRALTRFVRGGGAEGGGRFVPPELLLEHAATQNFESVRTKLDMSELYDNEGTAPKLVDRR